MPTRSWVEVITAGSWGSLGWRSGGLPPRERRVRAPRGLPTANAAGDGAPDEAPAPIHPTRARSSAFASGTRQRSLARAGRGSRTRGTCESVVKNVRALDDTPLRALGAGLGSPTPRASLSPPGG